MEYQEFNTKTTNKYLKNYHIKTNQDAIGLHDEVIALEKDVLGVKNQNKYTLQKLNGEKLSNLSLDTLFANHGNNAPVVGSIKSKYSNQKIIAWASQDGTKFLINEKGKLVELK